MPIQLTPAERRLILAQLRNEAIEWDRQLGCTCEPSMTLTDEGFGPYNLPMWISDHGDDCELVTMGVYTNKNTKGD